MLTKANHWLGATVSVILLLLLTFLSVYSSEMNTSLSVEWVMSIAFICIMLKGYIIVERFMGLSRAPTFWRYLVLSYVVIVPSVLAVIYWVSL